MKRCPRCHRARARFHWHWKICGRCFSAIRSSAATKREAARRDPLGIRSIVRAEVRRIAALAIRQWAVRA